MTTTPVLTPNRCSHAGCRTTRPCRIETHVGSFTGAVPVRADQLEPGDVVVDENGERKFAAFDVEHTDPVRVHTAERDQLAGWAPVLTHELHDTFLVVRRPRP